jgi:hypothetical protein
MPHYVDSGWNLPFSGKTDLFGDFSVFFKGQFDYVVFSMSGSILVWSGLLGLMQELSSKQ